MAIGSVALWLERIHACPSVLYVTMNSKKQFRFPLNISRDGRPTNDLENVHINFIVSSAIDLNLT